MSLCQEPDNPHDLFAVSVKCRFPGKLSEIVVGHVPIEISRYIFFSIKHGCVYTICVEDEKPCRSPLTQGGLEVKCQVTATWDNDKGRKILTQSIERNYKFSNSLIDDSEEILRSLGTANW